LETNTRITKSALKNLNEVSKNVVNKFNDSLKLRKTSIFLLTTSAKLIETVWGKLPGSIADLAVKLFSNIEKEKRVVVYQTRNIHKELIRSRIENYVETYILKVEK